MAIQPMLDIARERLGADVAFVAEFADGQRHFRYVSAADPRDGALLAGASDPLEQSYCLRVVDGRMPPVIPDTRDHAEARSLAVTEQLGIRGYAGVPVVLGSGRVYGTLCAFTRAQQPRLEPHIADSLELLAALVAERLGEQEREADQRADQQAAIRALLPAVYTVLQPIVSVADGRDIGYEALARFDRSDVDVGTVFDMAAAIGLSCELEVVALRAALARLPELPAGTHLAVNLDADVLVETEAQDLLLAADPTRTVLELTERGQSSHPQELARVLDRLRGAGLRIALDDVGAGYASLQQVLRISPDVVKLDRELIAGIDGDLARRALVTAVTSFAAEVGATVVAEGVETGGELARLAVLGVDAVQGYLLGRPEPAPWDRDSQTTA